MRVFVNSGKDVAKLKREDELLNLKNKPARLGIIKKEVFDLMTSKLIRRGEKTTPDVKHKTA